ncbi:MAG: aldo/keto reductase [Clostridia bacterium]|nr:aldo/keto reductase [Clostridia bacterium]
MGGYGWGDTQEQDFIDAINVALDNGVNFFDTADTYGLGQSEITLAKGLGNRRKDVIIESKFGVRIIDGKTIYDNSPKYIEEALEATLKRLNTTYVDIYTIHYRDEVTPLSVVVEKLIELREKGKIRYFGLSNIKDRDIDELKKYKGLFVNCQDEFSLACRKNEKALSKIEALCDVTPMTWGSLGQGILTGKYNADSKFDKNDRRSRDIYVNFHGEKLLQNLKIVEYLKQVASNHNKSIAACAIRFILDYFPNSVVLAGVKKPSQLLSNIEAMGWHLTNEEFVELNRLSFDVRSTK